MKVKNSIISLVRGDITDLEVDAIVNAANSQLVLGAGVAGAIRKKGGPAIQRECDAIGGTPVGTAVITSGGELKAKYVIHAVGPRAGEGDEDEKLASATRNSLEVADKYGLKTIALPALSTGVFGFPIERCAHIMVAAVQQYLESQTGLKTVIFCLFDQRGYDIFSAELEEKTLP